jgi:protein TonB
VRVSPAGRVLDVQLERSSGRSVLDRAATDAVRRWRFHPARRDGMAVEGSVVVPVQFRLDEPA